MVMVQAVAFVAGVAIVTYTGFAALRTVVVPRAASTMINRVVFIGVRKIFDLLAHERRSFRDRDRVLALYGPLCLVLLPFVWISLMIIGFTLILWGLNVEPLRQAFILSGSSIFTLGFAAPTSLPIDLIVFFEAMIGLGLVALLISYLPSIYGAFARREQLVGGLEVRAGSPPTAGQLLARYAQIGGMDDGRQRAVQAVGAVVRRCRGEPRLVRGSGLLPLAATRAVVGDCGRLRARHRRRSSRRWSTALAAARPS